MSIVHLHLLLNHVPVVGILFVALVLIVALRLRNSDVSKFGLWLLAGIGAVSAIVYFTGEPAEDAVEHVAGVTDVSIHAHEFAAEVSFVVAAVVAAFAIIALLLFRRSVVPRGVTNGFLVLSLIIAGFMAWTANLGGRIRHSEISGGTATSAGEVERDRDR